MADTAPTPESNTPATAAPATKSATPFKFDEAKCEAKLQEITKFLMSFAGKAGYNPFFPLRDNIEPLSNRLASGEKSEALQNAIMSLQPTEPKIEVNYRPVVSPN